MFAIAIGADLITNGNNLCLVIVIYIIEIYI